MRHKISKWFWVWNFDKEEAWLNEMAAKGLALVSVGFCRYEFEDSLPGEYKIGMEFLPKERTEREKYIEFIEATGAEQVGYFVRWVYFRKKADSDFKLHSDNESRVRHLTTVIRLVTFVALLNLYFGIYNLFLAFFIDSAVNYVGFINLALSLLAFWGILRLCRKRKRLREEQQIFDN